MPSGSDVSWRLRYLPETVFDGHSHEIVGIVDLCLRRDHTGGVSLYVSLVRPPSDKLLLRMRQAGHSCTLCLIGQH